MTTTIVRKIRNSSLLLVLAATQRSIFVTERKFVQQQKSIKKVGLPSGLGTAKFNNIDSFFKICKKKRPFNTSKVVCDVECIHTWSFETIYKV